MRSKQGDDVRVIIFVNRPRGGTPGSTEKPPFCIWVQRKMRRRGVGCRGGEGGERALITRMIRKNEDGEGGY